MRIIALLALAAMLSGCVAYPAYRGHGYHNHRPIHHHHHRR